LRQAAAWIIYFLVRYGSVAVTADPSQNFLTYAHVLLERYDYQIRLLKAVKYWYLLPLYVGLLITTVALWRVQGD
jgi:hypothetical protein